MSLLLKELALSKHADLSQQAGELRPKQKLQIEDFVLMYWNDVDFIRIFLRSESRQGKTPTRVKVGLFGLVPEAP